MVLSSSLASAVPARLILYQNNTQLVQVFGLRDSNGNFMNTGTLTATLLDSNREPVPGCQTVSMQYVGASNGDYSGVVGPIFAAECGSEYTMVIDGDAGSAHIHLELTTEVRVRMR